MADVEIKSLQQKDEQFKVAQRSASNQENFTVAAFIKKERIKLVCQLLYLRVH